MFSSCRRIAVELLSSNDREVSHTMTSVFSSGWRDDELLHKRPILLFKLRVFTPNTLINIDKVRLANIYILFITLYVKHSLKIHGDSS